MQQNFGRNFQNSNSDHAERLRKAIERNRAKMQQREAKSGFSRPDNYGRQNQFNQDKSEDRRGVARPNDFSFSAPFRKITNKISPISIEYNPEKLEKKIVTKTSYYLDLAKKYFLKLAWPFSLFVIARLIFVERGVVDYYQRLSYVDELQEQIILLEEGNAELEKDIRALKTSRTYQKKAVRDNLGFIAEDEFLMVFSDP